MTDLPSAREVARIELVRNAVRNDETLDRALAHACELSARTLDVDRVGIWVFEDHDRTIRCCMQYLRGTGPVASGDVIVLATCPSYAAALRTRRAVAADDVRSDPRTAELREYLDRYAITSMLDSPIFRGGEPVGILCHEHIGPMRSWSKHELHFAATVSDMIGLYLEQDGRLKAERALRDARLELEKKHVMESLGRMAAGVAHDFNNILAAIGLKAELMERHGAKEGADEQTIRDIVALVAQGTRLVRQLMAFVRREPTFETIDLVEVVRSMEPILRTFEPHGIAIELRLPSDPAFIHLDRSRAEQVLMNLAVNARDAMVGGGTLTIEVGHTTDDVFLRVVDTGVGMDEHTRLHLFEPFFTTKPAGLGVGLGLSTVYGIVEESSGRIDVTSERGDGTEICIRWDRVRP